MATLRIYEESGKLYWCYQPQGHKTAPYDVESGNCPMNNLDSALDWAQQQWPTAEITVDA